MIAEKFNQNDQFEEEISPSSLYSDPNIPENPDFFGALLDFAASSYLKYVEHQIESRLAGEVLQGLGDILGDPNFFANHLKDALIDLFGTEYVDFTQIPVELFNQMITRTGITVCKYILENPHLNMYTDLSGFVDKETGKLEA